jgi:hypothetical protein
MNTNETILRAQIRTLEHQLYVTEDRDEIRRIKATKATLEIELSNLVLAKGRNHVSVG